MFKPVNQRSTHFLSAVLLIVIAFGAFAFPRAAAAGPAAVLTADEADSLRFMLEEEKFARDVYTYLFATWNQPVFQSIAASEQTHMDAIASLFNNYGLSLPVMTPGKFSNPDLQALYNKLTVEGKASLAAALKVGAAIEEIDILDLQTRLAKTSKLDIQQVFNNLMRGSYNHLFAFTNTLQRQTGESYQPRYMTAEQYQVALSSINGNRYGGAAVGGQVVAGAAGQRTNGYGNGRWGAGSVLPTTQP